MIYRTSSNSMFQMWSGLGSKSEAWSWDCSFSYSLTIVRSTHWAENFSRSRSWSNINSVNWSKNI